MRYRRSPFYLLLRPTYSWVLLRNATVSYTRPTFDWNRQFDIASEKVRNLARKRLSGEISAHDFKREIETFNADELGQLSVLLLKAPLHAEEENVEDAGGPLFEKT